MRLPTRRFIALLLCVLCSAWPVHAQSGEPPPVTLSPAVRFTRLTTADGLPINATSSVLQDRTGFIWLGTQDGLSRYDGYTFTTYRHDPARADSLGANQVERVLEDRAGQIWVVLTDHGVDRFDPLTERFTHYRFDPQDTTSVGGNNLHAVYQDRAGVLWLAGLQPSGLNAFDPTTGMFTRHAFPREPFPRGAVWQMQEDDAGAFWLTLNHDLVHYDPRTAAYTAYTPHPDERQLAALYQDVEGMLWVGGSTGLYRFDPATTHFTAYPGPTRINKILPDALGQLWIATNDNGLYVFDPRTASVSAHYRTDALDPTSLSSDEIEDLHFDRAGLLWIATDAGVNVYDPRQSRFAHYRYDPRTPEGLSGADVRALVGDAHGHVWLGIGATLERVDLSDGRVTHFQLPTDDGAPATITTLYLDHAEILWVGLNQERVYRFDPQSGTGEFMRLPRQPSPRPLPPTHIAGFAEDNEGGLWVALSLYGLFRIAPDRASIEDAFHLAPGPETETRADTLASATVSALARDASGTLWIGYQNGAFSRFNPAQRTFRHYLTRPAPRAENEIEPNWITAIQADARGTLWLATQAGLVRFDPRTEGFTRYTEADGLPNAFIVAVLEDRAGALWLATQHGLVRFDPETQQMHAYDGLDGLQGDTFNAAAWRASDGRLYFGGTNGLSAFYPEQIEDSTYQAPVVLTALTRFNQPVVLGEGAQLTRPLWATRALTFAHDENFLAFTFAALDYSAPLKNRYQYYLDGYDAGWITAGATQRTATYTGLPAGDYILRVRASNADGVWSAQEVALAVVVEPAWWETLWFRGLLVLGAGGALYALFRWRLQGVEQRNRLALAAQEGRMAVLEERERLGRDLHDDLGQLLGYVNVQAQAAQDLLDAGRLDQTRATLMQVAEVAREAHQSVRQHILGLRTPTPAATTDTPPDFFAALTAYCTQLETRYGLHVQLSLPAELTTSPLAPDAETQALRIIQEALTNVRKHAKVQRARVLFTLHADTLQIVIADDGPGFVPGEPGGQAQSGHFGLDILRERAAAVGGTLELRTAPGTGTQVIARLPRRLQGGAAEGATVRGLRILLADDHPLFVEGLRNLLSARGITVVGIARSGREAEALAARLRPDLILMDCEMPDGDGVTATQQIKVAQPEVRIVMLSAAADDERLFTALRAGASGYLLKDLEGTHFFDLLGDIMRGQTVLSPGLATRVLAEFAQGPARAEAAVPVLGPTLTPQQRKVLECIAQGQSNKEIAQALQISEATVKYHVGQLLERLHLRSRHQLDAFARTHGLFTPAADEG